MTTYRYTDATNTVAHIIDADGVSRSSALVSSLPEGVEVLPYTPPAKTYDEVWSEIKAIRDHKTQNGGFPASGKWFHSDTFSRSQHLGMVMKGASLPSIPWKTMDGTFIMTTPALAEEIFAAAFLQDGALFAHAEALRAQAVVDPNSVDITAGWPATFEDEA